MAPCQDMRNGAPGEVELEQAYVDFALTDEQEAIRDMAQRFAADELAPHATEWDEKKHSNVPDIEVTI